MITIRKLASLPRRTRLRKIVHLLESFERECLAGRPVDGRYVGEMAGLLQDDGKLDDRLREAARRVAELRAGTGGPAADGAAPGGATADPEVCRVLDSLRNALLAWFGREPAEWDLLLPEGGGLDRSAREVRDFFVYLEDLRSPYNVGAIFRSAESFGVRGIYLSPDTPRPDHPRAARSSMGATEVIPWRVCGLEEALLEAGAAVAGTAGAGGGEAPVPVFALETGGTPLEQAVLPEPGLVVLGSEELGLSPAALSRAESSAGRLSIPMAGAKASLNVAVAFGIIVHAWWGQKKPTGETPRSAP